MSHIKFTSSFIRGFIHQDFTAGTSASTLLATASTPERRVIVIVQNKSATATIQLIFADTGSVGIQIPPLGNISLDNYNGIIRVISSAASTNVHLAYAVV